MCGQDNYATGAKVHADWWEGLCTTALKLDLFDFTESGYALPRHNTHGSRSGPSPSKRKLRSSQESPAKKKRGPPLKEIEEESSEDDVALAQIKADAAKERQENMELHRSTQSWMERESQTNREFLLSLLNIRNAQPMAAIAPDGSSPKLQLEGVPSGSNNSGASTHQMMPPAPPPLPTKEPVQVPFPPTEECVHGLCPVGGLAAEECHARSQEEAGCSSAPCNEVVVGHNLIGVSSEDEIGSDFLRTGDPPAGCVQ